MYAAYMYPRRGERATSPLRLNALRTRRLGDRTLAAIVPAGSRIAESADTPSQLSRRDQARKQLLVQPSQLLSLGGRERIEQFGERVEPSPLDPFSDRDAFGGRGDGNCASVVRAPSLRQLTPLQLVDQANGRGVAQAEHVAELLDRATGHEGRQGDEPSRPLAGARGRCACSGADPIGDSQRECPEEICLSLKLMHGA